MGKQPTWPQLCLEAGLADKLVVEGSEEGGSGGLEGGGVQAEEESQIHPLLSQAPAFQAHCSAVKLKSASREQADGAGRVWAKLEWARTLSE